MAKESAELRNAFKDPETTQRHRNVAKLMFIHMLGYPSHFGQMECLKLIANNSFNEKRIGYLALMLLLDENQEVTMLVTNSLKQDMGHKNHYIVGLALCSLGNICSAEMGRDLAPEVKKLMKSSSSYIKKKAALCAERIINKIPEMIPEFVEPTLEQLNGRAHGVLLASTTLAISICELAPGEIPTFRRGVPQLIKVLRNLVSSGHSTEHDVGGVSDPFLQVKILKLMAILGKGDAESSDLMSDILAQVATSTASKKNAGNAVLYECVKTIMTIESIGGQRVLAINVLGKFLANRDNNIRYVALNTLAQIVSIDPAAVQRHRETVINCVKDSDVSIRRRALDLVYGLVNEDNVETLARELLEYLMVCDDEFKADLAAKLCSLVEAYAPSVRWQVDIMVDILTQAGKHVPEEATRALIKNVTNAPAIQGYACRQFYRALLDNLDSHAPSLATTAIWCLGEYGDLLVAKGGMLEGEPPLSVAADEVLTAMSLVLQNPLLAADVKVMALTAAMKLSTRVPATAGEVQAVVAAYKTSPLLEVQQRACEFDKMFAHGPLRAQLLEQLPPMEDAAEAGAEANGAAAGPAPGAAGDDLEDLLGDLGGGPAPAAASAAPSGGDALADLLGGASLGVEAAAPPPAAAAAPAVGGDPLGDLLGMGAAPAAPAPPAAPAAPAAAVGGLADLMGGGAPAAPAPAAGGGWPPIVAYDNHGLKITFTFEKSPANPQLTTITATCTNGTPVGITNFSLQAAVPKFMQVRMAPVATNAIPPNNSRPLIQQMQVLNSMHGQKPIVMRLKVDFTVGVNAVGEMVEVSSFPPGL